VAEGDEDRSNDPTVGVGSVAAGGRYDNLVGMFSGKQQVPCVGISFGVERIFSITKQRLAADAQAAPIRSNEVDVYVMAFGGKGFDGLLTQRMQIARKLWDAGIKAEFSWKVKPKLPAQFKAAEVNGVPFAVVIGDEELKAGKCKIKEMGLPEGHPEKEGVMVDLDNLENEVKARLNKDGVDASITAGLGGLSLDQAAAEAPKTT
jgi:histidyl-tRNA synthetase